MFREGVNLINEFLKSSLKSEGSFLKKILLRDSKNLLHIKKAALLLDHELCCPKRALGKGFTGSGPMRELDALPISEKKDRVVAYDIAAAKRKHADLSTRPGSGFSLAAVDHVSF